MHVEKNNPYCTYAAIGSVLYHIERRYQNYHGWLYMDISSLLSEVKKSEIGCFESLGKKYDYYYYNHKDMGGKKEENLKVKTTTQPLHKPLVFQYVDYCNYDPVVPSR